MRKMERCKPLHYARRIFETIADFFTAEWAVRDRNGSGVVAARAICVALWACVLSLAAWNITICWIAGRECEPSRAAFANQLQDVAPFIAATFAGAYTAFYARFSRQWTYLAEVYNQIKDAQCAGGAESSHINDWKAGFTIDAKVLHLSREPLFAGVIDAWSKEPEVMRSLLGDSRDSAYKEWIAEILLDASRALRETHKKRQRKLLIREQAEEKRAEGHDRQLTPEGEREKRKEEQQRKRQKCELFFRWIPDEEEKKLEQSVVRRMEAAAKPPPRKDDPKIVELRKAVTRAEAAALRAEEAAKTASAKVSADDGSA